MPARSQAQRGYLAAHFGPGWMKKHGFDNKGPLPKHAKKPDQVALQLGKHGKSR